VRESDAVGAPAPAPATGPLVAVPDETSPTGFSYATREQAIGEEAPAPAASKERVRDERIREFVEKRGLTEQTAIDIVDTNVFFTRPTELGTIFAISKIPPFTKREIPEADAEIIVGLAGKQNEQPPSEQPQGEPPEGAPDRSAFEAVKEGIGPFAKVKAGFSNLFGPFIAGALYENTTNARQQLRIFRQSAKVVMTNNPRYPVAEQQLVAELLPDPDVLFKDPDTARSDLSRLKKELEKRNAGREKELRRSKITSKRKGELRDAISTANEILGLIGEESTGAEEPQGEPPEGVPEGSRLLGNNPRGNAIWEAPNGDQFEVIGESKTAPKAPAKKLPPETIPDVIS